MVAVGRGCTNLVLLAMTCDKLLQKSRGSRSQQTRITCRKSMCHSKSDSTALGTLGHGHAPTQITFFLNIFVLCLYYCRISAIINCPVTVATAGDNTHSESISFRPKIHRTMNYHLQYTHIAPSIAKVIDQCWILQ